MDSAGRILLMNISQYCERSMRSSCLKSYFNRMQVSTWPGGQGVLRQRPSLVQGLCQVSDVVRSQDQNVQLGQLGVWWNGGQSRLRRSRIQAPLQIYSTCLSSKTQRQTFIKTEKTTIKSPELELRLYNCLGNEEVQPYLIQDFIIGPATPE